MHGWGCACLEGVCAQGRDAQGVASMPRGHAWPGGCVAGVHAMHTPPQPDTMRYGRSMRGRYASYWNAFLSCFITCNMNKMLIPNYNKSF